MMMIQKNGTLSREVIVIISPIVRRLEIIKRSFLTLSQFKPREERFSRLSIDRPTDRLL